MPPVLVWKFQVSDQVCCKGFPVASDLALIAGKAVVPERLLERLFGLDSLAGAAGKVPATNDRPE